jgi:hypothetical protein
MHACTLHAASANQRGAPLAFGHGMTRATLHCHVPRPVRVCLLVCFTRSAESAMSNSRMWPDVYLQDGPASGKANIRMNDDLI